ncbi:hypothetical protein [Marinobacter qingdaonensis]|uniref:Lipoprotein n=1 Tax=Marinobacter qingdaonensis TaxID=3108486 RepID=A0ABU5P0L6_9GAMM|nr:hypothetical protein [Marinobacter sp. ASW11-75]MEA1081604.1 hypothetical protein [Marinobacter sp. ASW11-75]
MRYPLPLRVLSVATVMLLAACSSPRVTFDNDPLTREMTTRESYIENRCTADSRRSTQGIDHCQDATSIEQYEREYREYEREYEQSQGE